MEAYLSNFRQRFAESVSFNGATVGGPTIVLMILALLIVPLPAFFLDILFTFNIMLGLMMVMVAINTRTALEFSSFPAVLLVATLLRLGLNVASTRVVLVDGHTGTDAAGQVIEAFGDFVIAGNYVVGFIIFLILMIINFIVVTKGAGRVSEVIARFTLDAMPGKQMAIDADLNAGVINQEEAKVRRAELGQESDFYGSMDGASKFVRGDAVAGILILGINIIGGLIVGTTQHDLTLSAAGEIYVLLTIGDGLVAQIPSLLLSVATAILVTRVTTEESMAEQAATQVVSPTPILIASSIITVLGLVPGMPHIVFLPLGISGIVFAAYLIKTIDTQQVYEKEQEAIAERQAGSKELDWDDVDQVEIISLDIGYGLVPLASTDSGGELLTRIKGIRKKVSAELGFLVQPIRIRDNLELRPENYSISLHGVQRGSGFVRVGKLLAIHGSEQIEGIEGEQTEEPAFGLPATWIDPSKADFARTMGHTVVDAPTAIATHVSALIKENAHELLGQDETQELLDKVSKKYPKLVSNLVPDTLTLATVSQVLKNLLIDQIPVRDMRSIIEALSIHGKASDNAGDLVSLIRPSLGRMIVQPMLDGTGSLSVITLDPELEGLLEASKTGSNNEHVTIDPQLAKSFVDSLSVEAETLFDSGETPSLVVSPGLRNWMAKFVRPRIPDLSVISYTEIPDDQKINVRASVGATATLDNG